MFSPAVLGPEMAAPIHGRLEKCVLSAGKPHAHRIPRFRGGILVFQGGEVPTFYFYGRGDFSDRLPLHCNSEFPAGEN